MGDVHDALLLFMFDVNPSLEPLYPNTQSLPLAANPFL
jgi:hypothetical protein